MPQFVRQQSRVAVQQMSPTKSHAKVARWVPRLIKKLAESATLEGATPDKNRLLEVVECLEHALQLPPTCGGGRVV
jgi:hypothetical protein